MVNRVMLKGNVAQPPYFDRVGEEAFPFLRFYLAVDPDGLCDVVLRGNVAQPPYFDRVGEADRPFMRLYLAVDRPGDRGGADFLRVVAYDRVALLDYPYLQPGSEVLVAGRLRARKRKLSGGKTETVIEAVAGEHLAFLRKIDWQAGNAARQQLADEKAGPGGRIRPAGGGFFRVVTYRDRALFTYPYLQVGSELFVSGRLQARKRHLPDGKKKTVVEVVAERVDFLRNVDWEAGDAARDRIKALRGEAGP